MGTKELFGLTMIPAAVVGGIVVATMSKRIRDVFFVLLVFLAPFIQLLDVNFVSREWYRGTSRGFEVSLLDILSVSLLFGSILAPRRGTSRMYLPASLGLMLLFFFYAAFNVLLSDPKLFGLFELSKLCRGLVLFLAVAFYLRTERELRLLIFSLAISVAFQGLLAFKQRYVDGIHRVPGTVDDANSLSVFLCMTAPFFVAALNSRIPKWMKLACVATLVLAVLAEVLTISRAGIVVMAMVLVGTTLTTMSWRITARKSIIGVVVLVGVAGIAAKSWKTVQARFAEANLAQEYGKKKNMGRGYYIRVAEAIAEDNWLGVGLNNWSFWVSNKYGPKLGYKFVPYRGTDNEPSYIMPSETNVDTPQAAPAHSLAALTLGELGIPGLVLMGLLWIRWFQMGASFFWRRTTDSMRRMGVGIFFCLCGLFLQSLTEWVFRHSPIYYVAHILIGTLAALYYQKKRSRSELAPQPATLTPEMAGPFSKFNPATATAFRQV
jgi:hypothetical protein